MTCTLQKDLIVRNYKYKHQPKIRYHSNNVSKNWNLLELSISSNKLEEFIKWDNDSSNHYPIFQKIETFKVT